LASPVQSTAVQLGQDLLLFSLQPGDLALQCDEQVVWAAPSTVDGSMVVSGPITSAPGSAVAAQAATSAGAPSASSTVGGITDGSITCSILSTEQAGCLPRIIQ
jgi:hypothetical protein